MVNTADDAWAAFVPVRKMTVGAVRERFGADFVILMSDDGRYDRHVMRRFAATRVVYKRGCHYVDFLRACTNRFRQIFTDEKSPAVFDCRALLDL